MMAALLLIALILFGGLNADSISHNVKYDVYLLIGQSNMAGRGVLTEADLQETVEGVYLLGEDGTPVPATHPFNRYSTIRKSMNMQGMNPGYGFAKVMKPASKRPILIVCNAKGGTSILQWEKGAEDGFFEQAVERCRMAMKYGKLKGILWHQGCSDSGRTDEYMSLLVKLVSDLRSELKVGKKVPFIAGELARWRKESPAFNEMIHSISDNIPNSSYVSSEGCGMLRDENDPHFSREGQLLLGERYGRKMLEMQKK